MEYPVLCYLVVLRSEQTDVTFNMTLDSEKSGAVFGRDSEIEDNQRYVCTVTAINNVGTSTSEEKVIGKGYGR